MKKILFISICALSFYSNVHAQQATFENITYKTKQEDSSAYKPLLQRLFNPKEKPPVPVEKTIIAKVLVKGKVSLYMVDEYPGKCDLAYGTKPFYFIKTDQGTFPLLHKEDIGSYPAIQPYKNMLTYCLQDWNEAMDAIKDNAYSVDGLSRIILNYNKAMGKVAK